MDKIKPADIDGSMDEEKRGEEYWRWRALLALPLHL